MSTLSKGRFGEELAGPLANVVVARQKSPSERGFIFLLGQVKKLFDLGAGDDIYQFIASALQEFLNAGVVLANAYNEVKNTLDVRGVAGLGSYTEKILHMIGSNPAEISTLVSEACRQGLSAGRLTILADGVYELANHTMPLIVCRNLEELLGIRFVYAMGLTWHEKLLGSVAFLNREEIRDPAVVETFLNYAALAIRQRMEKES
ncbi:MAG: hypothetical protein PHR43_01045 [Dehalococcoidales bacterium]|nr:hypothetical protein [Dehalococcoidales bacterium]